jgi:hypothetical protein
MRGITLATSIHHTSITVYGKLDVLQVRMMMIKPAASVAMRFGSGDPYEGMQTLRFGGAAVSFLPTVEFSQQRQASLR